jgi:formate dehydrogenase iron-sulfur subunit
MIRPGEAYVFYTDTTVCIGCKACQVACHQWNDLPNGHGPAVNSDLGLERPALARGQEGGAGGAARYPVPLPVLSGDSYDNTGSLSDVNWRHVKFIEQQRPGDERVAWLMMSDVCKHCVNAPCLEVCPTGALLRTEFDSVYINEPACNGCRDCVGACPFGVIHMGERKDFGPDRVGVAKKCTFCYDRLKRGVQPACAQACPTQSIRFGRRQDMLERANARVDQAKAEGWTKAQLYGHDDKVLGGLNAFYLLADDPEVYGLPRQPKIPSRSLPGSSLLSMLAGLFTALAVVFSFRTRTQGHPAPATPRGARP